MPTKKRTAAADGLTARATFRRKLAANPNHFGTQPETGLKAVQKIVASTAFEKLTSIGYDPKRRTAHATFDLVQSNGYGGDLCTGTGDEYVRFYAGDGSGGWVDLGHVGTDVHDVPAGKDCRGRSTHPLSYTVEVPYAPTRRWCFVPQVRRLRAILAYDVVPPANQPDWTPVWGDVRECDVQIDKSTWLLDLFTDVEFTKTIDPHILDVIAPHLPKPPQPPDPGPFGPLVPPELPELQPQPQPSLPRGPGPDPLPLSARFEAYAEGGRKARFSVEPARIALPELHALTTTPFVGQPLPTELTAVLDTWKLDIGDLVAVLEDTTGNVDYEELVDVGLDYRRHRVDATYVVKKGAGYSGGLCSAGSTEYVAFWADWDDTCEWTYLGTAELKAYDLGALVDDHLCYTASLPVDLAAVMAHCSDPKVGKVRAVLSWNTPPSTTDPDAVPYYGNRLDTHVLVPTLVAPSATLAIVGGVPASLISDADGLTLPGAHFDGSWTSVDAYGRRCPFGGRISVKGIGPVGTRYRVRVVAPSGVQTLTGSFWVTNSLGVPSLNTAAPGGWFTYLSPVDNVGGTLAVYPSAGDEKVDVVLEIEGVGDVDHQVVQLDNTAPTAAVDLTTPGNCEVASPTTTITGTVSTSDAYPGSWSVVIDGGPPGFGPYVIATGTTNAGGQSWSTATPAQPFPASLVPCGYVARLVVRDRAVVNDGGGNNVASTDVGFSVV